MTHSSHRRHLLAAAAAAGLVAPLATLAQSKGFTPTEGRHFSPVRPPQPTESAGKIEVTEFFWYGCPACNAVEPALEAWRKQAPSDVAYRRIPVSFDAQRTPHSKIYYTLEAVKKLDEVHPKVFAAIHREKRRLLDTNEIATFMAAQGIDQKAWLDAYNSFTVATRTNKAQQTWNAYRIEGTPSVGVDGKWITSPSQAGGLDEFIGTLNALVERARRERGGGAAKK